MRLLLTNDDGIGAPGLSALAKAAEGLGEAITVAPSGPQSGCGHAVTTHRSLIITTHEPGRFSVDGTPGDCVRLALHHLASDVDWVLSGINAGANLGADVFHSGTVAAAREAAFHGRPAIAVSQYLLRGKPPDWERATIMTRVVLKLLLDRVWTPGTFWNVNLPHVDSEPEIVFCPLDTSPLPLKFRVEGNSALYCGDYQSRARRPGGDVAVCFGGAISVTLVALVGEPFESAPP